MPSWQVPVLKGKGLAQNAQKRKKAPGNGIKLLEQSFFLLVVVFKNFLLVECTEAGILKEKYYKFCFRSSDYIQRENTKGFSFFLALTISEFFFHSKYFNPKIIFLTVDESLKTHINICVSACEVIFNGFFPNC